MSKPQEPAKQSRGFARLIPCLDVTDGRVVKGVNFVGLRDAGDPVELATRYDTEGADEVVFLDITASSDARQTMVDIVNRAAEQLFIPLTVGGGVRDAESARRLLRAGADKVSVNTAAVRRPELISEIADDFGNQCVVCAIDAKRSGVSRYEVFVNGGRTPTGIDVHEWAQRAVALGAGGDPPHLDGSRRHARRLRPRAHAVGRRRRARAGDCERWCRHARPSG